MSFLLSPRTQKEGRDRTIAGQLLFEANRSLMLVESSVEQAKMEFRASGKGAFAGEAEALQQEALEMLARLQALQRQARQ